MNHNRAVRRMKKCKPCVFLIMLFSLLFIGQISAAIGAELQVKAAKPGANVTVEGEVADDKLILSVNDASNYPVHGLTTSDFVITKSGKTARILSVQPIAESVDVPRNIILVLDNSYSMRERYAIKPLLAGVDELLKIVRPIDVVHIVVFAEEKTVKIGGRNLQVQTFKSNHPIELKNFVTKIYRDNITSGTVLFEGILAGLDIIRALPENEPRFLVVFSDGEDLNSAYKGDVVFKELEGMKRFNAYAIDYMPDASINQFLKTFSERNNGQIWKATSDTNLVEIFQKVASKMEYSYMVSYLFPTTGNLTVTPASITIDEVENFDATAAAGVAVSRRIDTTTLKLRPVVDTAYGVARWKATVSNSSGILGVQSGEGAPAPETAIAFKADDIERLISGGDIKVTMEIEDKKGQTITLAGLPVKIKQVRTTGIIAIAPSSLTIEEVKTIDSSPMLGHIYFPEGSGEIPSQYVRLSGASETASFDEQSFRDTLEKYYQVLNIIGKRLTARPDATITIIGCNSDTGVEKNKKKLSAARAEAVRDYFQTVWNIAPERMKLEARNLPLRPSARNLKEGQAENRRVEIQSADLEILAPIRSVYLATRIDNKAVKLSPKVISPNGIESWKLTVANANGSIANLEGKGAPEVEIDVPIVTSKLEDLAKGGDIAVKMEVQDLKGQVIMLSPTPVKVNFIQRSQRLALKQEQRIQEKYALILFDFDKDTIEADNQDIVNRIVSRIRQLGQPSVDIVGHTDNIGRKEYNIKLSERRALSVYKLMTTAFAGSSTEFIRHRGVGSDQPLYDNMSPEARSFNRTVTITLEYMATE